MPEPHPGGHPAKWAQLRRPVSSNSIVAYFASGKRSRFYVCNQFFHTYSSSDADICHREVELGSGYGGCWCRFGGRISILFFILLYC